MGDGISGPTQSQFNQARYCVNWQYRASSWVPSEGSTSCTHSRNSPHETVFPLDCSKVLLGFISTLSPSEESRQMLPGISIQRRDQNNEKISQSLLLFFFAMQTYTDIHCLPEGCLGNDSSVATKTKYKEIAITIYFFGASASWWFLCSFFRRVREFLRRVIMYEIACPMQYLLTF